jgi:lysophospholipase L1-like esterase
VNYSCPGESTVTFVHGGCPWLGEGRKLHDPFRGTQLTAALAFLAIHRGQVSPITVHLWGNDIDPVADACRGDLKCIEKRAPAAIARIGSRLGEILRRLRTAAPNAEIIVNGAWNFNADDLPRTDPLFRSLDSAIRRATIGAKASFADILPLFNPQGNVAREKARVCSLLFICKRDDPHPTDAGYREIANAVWKASGY